MLARRGLLGLGGVLLLSGCAAAADPRSPRPTPSGTPAAPAGSLAAGADASAAVRAQLDYALAHWADTENAEFGHLGVTDCVNFTSQTLLARGWQQDDDWWYANDGGSVDYAPAWISSTALMNYLLDRPEKAVALDDEQRASVALGDIVQFDWDRSGDRDHTGVITAVHTDESGRTRLRYACHSGGEDYYDIDTEITKRHPDAAVYYWSLA
ncbi:amidase domain-containing protein [Microbacteriaceae bacterium VKM Ac-2854]|nr:amidase domain-containing protein [Microbacteriaceae bacterium VKM Ac-2854]